jgi:hypothetical protein
MNKCNKIRIMFLCVVNLKTSIFHSTQHQTLGGRNKKLRGIGKETLCVYA